eukprot:CAMPEP_0185021022 /NCGR_PEP_ID=MMETSP1103-20130426/3684_1 /TAXON_ID=36769 /ORGANISM="Paraphysomonas bandaiensis, Strain Caron Lab Isolate" /LENGTH=466 /DNA_ID=CAMNT_0027552295 /DNA_START=242 /DNA_END=1639 /DNA_ORIENTATION=+
MTDQTIDMISNRWKIQDYPKFLKSVAMPHSSWDTLRVKFQSKILQGLLKNNNNELIISWMGSSVTAGHDTPFNLTFTERTGRLMAPAFEAVNIKINSRNVALGNNPCLPYDLCVNAFAGSDADIVHWEQSFNCDAGDFRKKDLFEQFVRQAMKLKSRPVVVFSNSFMPNWREDKCKEKKPVKVTDEDKFSFKLLQTVPKDIAAEVNKGAVRQHWNVLVDVIDKYRGAGIQVWNHGHYEEYKCHGPYIPDWGCCSAPWHPSKLGHELRAAHFSFFWLLIFKDAINTILSHSDQNLEGFQALVEKHIKAEVHHIPPAPIYPSPYNGVQCYTSFQPRANDDFSLEGLVLRNNDGSKGFELAIFEMLTDPNIIKKAKSQGYRDFKYMLYGNKESGPLSLSAKVTAPGNSFICQPPGNWGKVPKGFKNFWECDTEFYLTENVKDKDSFSFKKETARRLTYTQKHPKDSQSW